VIVRVHTILSLRERVLCSVLMRNDACVIVHASACSSHFPCACVFDFSFSAACAWPLALVILFPCACWFFVFSCLCMLLHIYAVVLSPVLVFLFRMRICTFMMVSSRVFFVLMCLLLCLCFRAIVIACVCSLGSS
jgi:hypothetical protein